MKCVKKAVAWTLSILLLVGALGLVSLGCESLDGGDTETTEVPDVTSTSATDVSENGETTSSATEATSSPASTVTTLASTEEVLPNGHIRSMGFIDDVWMDPSGRHLSIDYCDIVSGEEATEAARADGLIGPTEEWDLDFYVRNQSPRLREWDVSNSVAITTATRWPPHDGFEVACTWADFLSFWSGGSLPEGDSHMYEVPWWIERDGNTVVKIDEQYLP